MKTYAETVAEMRYLMRTRGRQVWKFRNSARMYAHGWAEELRATRPQTKEERAREARILKTCREFIRTGRKQRGTR